MKSHFHEWLQNYSIHFNSVLFFCNYMSTMPSLSWPRGLNVEGKVPNNRTELPLQLGRLLVTLWSSGQLLPSNSGYLYLYRWYDMYQHEATRRRRGMNSGSRKNRISRLTTRVRPFNLGLGFFTLKSYVRHTFSQPSVDQFGWSVDFWPRVSSNVRIISAKLVHIQPGKGVSDTISEAKYSNLK